MVSSLAVMYLRFVCVVLCLVGKANLSLWEDYTEEEQLAVEDRLNMNLMRFMRVKYFRTYLDHLPVDSNVDPVNFLMNAGLIPNGMTPNEIELDLATAQAAGPGPEIDRTNPVAIPDGLIDMFTTRSFAREPWDVFTLNSNRTLDYDVIVQSIVQEIAARARCSRARRRIPYVGRQRVKLRAKFGLTIYREFLARLDSYRRVMLGFDAHTLCPIYRFGFPRFLGQQQQSTTNQVNLTTQSGGSSSSTAPSVAQHLADANGLVTESISTSSSTGTVISRQYHLVVGGSQRAKLNSDLLESVTATSQWTVPLLVSSISAVVGALFCLATRMFSATLNKPRIPVSMANYFALSVKVE